MNKSEATCFLEWQMVVSESNWMKGDILVAFKTENKRRSIKYFANTIGGISVEFAKLLHNVAETFSGMRREERFQELIWAHFAAALEWDDAIEWLEQASAGRWTVGNMKKHRLEAQVENEEFVIDAERDIAG